MSKKSLLFRLHDLAERIHGVTDFLEKELEHPDPAPVNKYHPDSIFSKFKGCIKCGSTDYANGGSWDAYYNFICHDCGIKSLKKDPAPPLKARVAKALGNTLRFYRGLWWMMKADDSDQIPLDIPPYDEDVKLAIGALEEYARENDLIIRMMFNADCSNIWTCRCENADRGESTSLARAICEAIVKHKESGIAPFITIEIPGDGKFSEGND